MSEPKTIREYRVALRYARGEANIAKAEATRLREHIEHHRHVSMVRNECAAQDHALWKVLEDARCPCCGETYTPAEDEIAMQCACENENCDENCPHVGHLFGAEVQGWFEPTPEDESRWNDTSEVEERFWKRVGEYARKQGQDDG